MARRLTTRRRIMMDLRHPCIEAVPPISSICSQPVPMLNYMAMLDWMWMDVSERAGNEKHGLKS